MVSPQVPVTQRIKISITWAEVSFTQPFVWNVVNDLWKIWRGWCLAMRCCSMLLVCHSWPPLHNIGAFIAPILNTDRSVLVLKIRTCFLIQSSRTFHCFFLQLIQLLLFFNVFKCHAWQAPNVFVPGLYVSLITLPLVCRPYLLIKILEAEACVKALLYLPA